MDSNIARWSQLVYLDQTDIDGLHRVEKSRAKRCGPSNQPLFVQKGLPDWKQAEEIARLTMSLSSDGYWPPGMTDSQKNLSLFEFGRKIYPIWKGIEERDIAEDLKKSVEEHAAPGQYIYECLTLHKCDLGIYRSHHKPNRIFTTPVNAKAGNKFGQWAGRGE